MKNAFLFASLLLAVPAIAQEDMDMNINMGGMGMGIDMNVSVRTTTTTSGNMHVMDPGFAPAPAAAPAHYIMPGYNGPIGCPWPMDEGQFAGARNSIGRSSFDDSRLTMAKQVVGANCLTVSQVRDLMMMLTFEESRLDLAKFSYARTFDLGNYFMLNDAFTFDMSIEELNEFIHGGF